MNFRMLTVRALDLPPKTLIQKGAVAINRRIQRRIQKLKARRQSTRTSTETFKGKVPTRILHTSILKHEVESLFPCLKEFNDRSLRHEFDLLGSGWTPVAHGIKCEGVEGHRYDAEAHDAVSKGNLVASDETAALIRAPYQPIDWQIDFKSGYRWSNAAFYTDIRYRNIPGVDIKVPWELARMQHLPALACEWALGNERQQVLADEFRNQIIDFIAQNPPLFGVNWFCAMDVGIRAANWILALDLFRNFGHEFDAAFYEIFLASLEDHGRFIMGNLEKYPDFRGNHYLANLAGLAFIASALPQESSQREPWLVFAEHELVRETAHQFQNDGSNFEASTSYHRLSGEMLIAALSVLRGQGRQFKELDSDLLNRIRGISEFSKAVTKPSGTIVQIGDTDSGRFFKLPPRFLAQASSTSTALEENHLDHSDLIAAIEAFWGHAQHAKPMLSSHIIKSLIGTTSSLAIQTSTPTVVPDISARSAKRENSQRPRPATIRDYTFPLPKGATDNLSVHHFVDFGLVIFKSDRVFLSFRCGPIGQNGRGGHDHDDQLSIELEIDGQTIVADPGTYLYTPLPQRRNQYRSAAAHFMPRFEDDIGADLEAGLFYLRSVEAGVVTSLSDLEVTGRCRRDGRDVSRQIEFTKDSIQIRDSANEGTLIDLKLAEPMPYSRGYGWRAKRP